MKWKEITSNYETNCSECDGDIDEEERCYWKKKKGETKGIVICKECHARYGANQDNSTPDSTTTTDRSTTDRTTTTPTPVVPSREEAIMKAHAENMAANQALVLQLSCMTTAIVDLMRVEEDRNKLLKQGLKKEAEKR